MEALKPPEPLRIEGNLSENWKKCWQCFEFYLTATGISEKDNKIKTSTFLHVIGQEALDIYNTFKFETAGDELKLDKVQEKFKNYCNPRKILTYERHVFFTRNQNRNETIDQYVTDLRNKASTYDFGDLCDSLIKDRLICGVADEDVRERLLRDADLTLAKAIDICRASVLRNGLNRAYCSVSARLKCQF